jgi:hypothetical protein
VEPNITLLAGDLFRSAGRPASYSAGELGQIEIPVGFLGRAARTARSLLPLHLAPGCTHDDVPDSAGPPHRTVGVAIEGGNDVGSKSEVLSSGDLDALYRADMNQSYCGGTFSGDDT